MWPFNNNPKQKLRSQDALKRYQDWLKKWMLKGAKFYVVGLVISAILLIGSFAAVKYYVLAPTQPVNNTIDETIPTETQTKNPVQPATKGQSTTKEQTQQPKPDSEPTVDVSQLTMPVTGTVITGFNDPYYSQTYNDYRFSEGIQFQTEPSEPVKAALAGKITTLDQDPDNKYTIVIDHGQGYQTKYQGLDSIAVSMEQQIEKGQALGTTDSLKFTLTQEQTPINPVQE